jgi:pimeloyl-ACP methyl ester carboxylesterase
VERKVFRTGDGVELSYLEGGSGPPLILLPGWSQTAAMYGQSFAALTAVARVIALDHRGHGESSKPDRGYRVMCLSKDLFDLIRALGLERPDVVGHSTGATVIWSYLALFAAERPLRRQACLPVVQSFKTHARPSSRGSTLFV